MQRVQGDETEEEVCQEGSHGGGLAMLSSAGLRSSKLRVSVVGGVAVLRDRVKPPRNGGLKAKTADKKGEEPCGGRLSFLQKPNTYDLGISFKV